MATVSFQTAGGKLRFAPSARWLFLITFGWAQCALLLWWAGVWPGLLSPDSRRYIIHVTSGPWTADHSVLYDSLVLMSLKLSGNVALLTLAQTTVAAAVLGYAVAVVRAAGVAPVWAILPGLIMPFVPSFGASMVTVWKDVPFALVEMLIVLTTIQIVRGPRGPDGRFRLSPRLMWCLGAELTLLCLFRNDGSLMLVVMAVGLLIGLRGARRQVIAVAAAALVILVGAQTIVYPAAGIKPASSSLAYGVFYGDIALAYAQHPRQFTAQDRALMSSVAPLSQWASSNSCFTSDPLFAKHFSQVKADAVRNRLAGLWFHTLARSPVSVIVGRLCRGAIAWSLLPPPPGIQFGGILSHTRADLYNGLAVGMSPHLIKKLRYQPLNRQLGDFEQSVRVGSVTPLWQILLMRGALWSYLTYLALLLAAFRFRRQGILLIGLMTFANQLTVAAANPAQLFRYMMGPLFIGMMLLPLFALRCWRVTAPTPSPTGKPGNVDHPAADQLFNIDGLTNPHSNATGVYRHPL